MRRFSSVRGVLSAVACVQCPAVIEPFITLTSVLFIVSHWLWSGLDVLEHISMNTLNS